MIDFSSLEPMIPERPDWLRGRQVELWDVVAPTLHARRILTLLDQPALAGLCVIVDRYLSLREAVKGGAEVGAQAEDFRLLARETAARFFMIQEDRVPLAPLNSAGDDEELLRWFDVPEKV